MTALPPSAEGGFQLGVKKIDKLGHAARVCAISLPPVIGVLTGLVVFQRKKNDSTVARKKASPDRRSRRDLRG